MDQPLQFLKEYFSEYRIRYSDDGKLATILNPYSDEHLLVEYVPDDDFTPYIACFSFQHWHLCDEEDVCDWIGEIISGKRCAIEFFSQGARCFGGDLDADDAAALSYDTLHRFAAEFGMSSLLQRMDAFKIRGWQPRQNIDGTLHADGSMILEFLLREGRS